MHGSVLYFRMSSFSLIPKGKDIESTSILAAILFEKKETDNEEIIKAQQDSHNFYHF